MKRNLLFAVFIVIFLSGFIVNAQINTNYVMEKKQELPLMHSFTAVTQSAKTQALTMSIPAPPTGLSTHTNLAILNDQQLATQAISGSGLVNDPYIIAGYNITSSSGALIDIENIDKYTIIQNCLLNGENYGGGAGIFVYNDSKLTITNTYIEQVGTAINANKGNIIVQSNIILPSNIGIEIQSSINAKFLSNQIFNPLTGLESLSNNQIEMNSNIIYNCSSYGIDINSDLNDLIISNSLSGTGAVGNYGLFSLSLSNSIVNNNTIDNYNRAIILLSGTQVNLTNNNIQNSTAYGISSSNSNKLVITQNTVSNSSYAGLYLNGDSHESVERNFISGAKQYGAWISLVSNSQFINNTVTNSGISFEVDSSSWDLISGNIFFNSQSLELVLSASQHTTISNSVFNGSSDFSLELTNGLNNVVTANTFTNANYYNIELINENNTVLEKNVFLDKPSFGSSQALDEGLNNLFAYNYWAGWTAPDSNNDGIVDNPYLINGPIQNYDLKPLATLSFPLSSGSSQTATTPSNSTTPNSSNTSNSTNVGAPVVNNPTITTVYVTSAVNSTTSSKSKASPGFTVVIFLATVPVIGFIAVLRRKRTN